MFEKCELYYYEGLYLNEEEINKLGINKTNGIGLAALLQNTDKVLEMNVDGYYVADKETLQLSAIREDKEYCYIIKKNILIVLPFKILYGIKNSKQIIAVWYYQNVRDAKFLEINKTASVSSITFEISSSQPMVEQYQEQLKLRKIHNNLRIN